MSWLFILSLLAIPRAGNTPELGVVQRPWVWPLKLFHIRYVEYPLFVASYYHRTLNGLPTASGELYSDRLMTAAHRTLPFGTIVTLCRDDAPWVCAEVRINDRGPFVPGREFDLSDAAAREIDMKKAGLLKVRRVDI